MDCARFAGQASLETYCAYLAALEIGDPVEALAACSRSGEWELSCRGEWVALWSRHDRGIDTGSLLEVCGDNHDCAFDLIESRPSGDTVLDIGRCEKNAGPYAQDCVKHMLNLWLAAEPEGAEIARLAAIQTPHAREVGQAVAYCLSCRGVGACEGSPEVTAQCERAVEDFKRQPERCPGGLVY